ncbi:MAG: hypothetical protein JXA00_05820 [Candidatus Thermoplasmatota archaeon]|nr:hypothetical protein [Candidatus Thermoplasmatota archaeon]
MRWKKNVAFLAVLVLLVPAYTVLRTAEGYPELVEYYSGENDDARANFGVYVRGQTFTVGTTGINKDYLIHNVTFYGCRVGNPGLFHMILRAADENGLPAGPNLSVGSMDGDLLSPNDSWVNVTMSDYILSTGTQYAVFIYAPNGNSNNNVKWLSEISSPTYTGGCLVVSDDGMATWSAALTQDFSFQIWGTDDVYQMDPYPAEGSIEIPLNPYLNITVQDPSGYLMDVQKRTNASGTWQTLFWLNNTQNVTMSNTTSGVFDDYGTCYWWSVNVSNGLSWSNCTRTFTTTVLDTAVDPITPYTQHAPRAMTVSGYPDVSNVTLYYRYSPDNTTWGPPSYDPANYNLTLTLADYISESTDPQMDYVNELVLNDDETVLFVVSHTKHAIVAIDVTQPWDMVKLDSFSNTSTTKAHSIDYFNYTAVGLPYGEVVFISQYNAAKTFVSFNVTNPSEILFMDKVTTNYILRGMYADVVYHSTTGSVIAALTGYNGTVVLLNVTDPNNMTVISHLDLGPTHEVWFPWFDENDNDYLYCTKNNGFGTNNNMPLIDVSDPTTPTVVNWVPCIGWPTRWSQIGSYTYGGDWDTEKVFVYDVSTPTQWVLVDARDVDFGAVHDSFHHPFYGDYLIGHAKEQDRLRAIYIKNGTPVFAGEVEQSGIYDTTHSGVVTADGSVFYGSTFVGIDEVHATNITFNGLCCSGPGWTVYETDHTYPWSWWFTFPEGAGYYEFYSIGRKTGSVDEETPATADALCHCTHLWSNTCPLASDEHPSNQSTNVSIYVGWWNVTISDHDGNVTSGTLDCSNGESIAWTDQPNGTRSLPLSPLLPATTYTVWLNFTDGQCEVNETYWFTTEGLAGASLDPEWNFIALPVNLSVNTTNLVVVNDGTLYTWGQAVAQGLIINDIFSWNATYQVYEFGPQITMLNPGQGYWMYAYQSCELWAINLTPLVTTEYITTLLTGWNMIGLPFTSAVNKTHLIVRYNNVEYNWTEATTNNPLVLGDLFGWEALLGQYYSADILQPGRCYWMYAYYDCILKKGV